MKEKKADIILVEDSDYDAELAMRALARVNLHKNLLHLRDGAEALDYFFGVRNEDEAFKLPRLVLMDLKMPKVNGIEVLQKVKSSDKTKTIPVVVLSSSNQEKDIEACYRYGANSYVVKPVEFDSYTKTVAEISSYWLMHNQTLK